MNLISANKFELMQMAESVAQEKNIGRDIVINAMEEAMARAANMRYGSELDIRAHYEVETGSLTLQRVRQVVEDVTNSAIEIAIEEARKIQPDIAIGEAIIDLLPSLGVDELDRINIQAAKQVIHRKVREAELNQQYEEYHDKIGHIVVGTVKGVEHGNIIVELPVGEAIIHRTQKIRQENPDKGSRIRAMIYQITQETRGHQIRLTRTSNEFMRELFRNEVPEFYEKNIDIKCIARDPGSRAKIAVVSYDASIDPVGACVGIRGSRVQAVVNELQGERVDIIPWSENEFEFITQALQPAQVTKGLLDGLGNLKTIVVPDDQLSLAIGKRGQNVRLARSLTGMEIEIISETHEREQREEMNNAIQTQFMEAMDIDENFARLLVTESFETVDYIAACNIEELTAINGIDDDIATELQERASDFITKENQETLAEARRYGLQEDLEKFELLTPKMLLALAQDKITSLNDFATLADWEIAGGFNEVKGRQIWEQGLLQTFDVNQDLANEMILTARLRVGIIDEEAFNSFFAQDDQTLEDDNEPGQTEES